MFYLQVLVRIQRLDLESCPALGGIGSHQRGTPRPTEHSGAECYPFLWLFCFSLGSLVGSCAVVWTCYSCVQGLRNMPRLLS